VRWFDKVKRLIGAGQVHSNTESISRKGAKHAKAKKIVLIRLKFTSKTGCFRLISTN
jgi:hypothetical protein